MDTAEHDKYTREEGKSKVHKMHVKPEMNPVNVTRTLCTYTRAHTTHVYSTRAHRVVHTTHVHSAHTLTYF